MVQQIDEVTMSLKLISSYIIAFGKIILGIVSMAVAYSNMNVGAFTIAKVNLLLWLSALLLIFGLGELIFNIFLYKNIQQSVNVGKGLNIASFVLNLVAFLQLTSGVVLLVNSILLSSDVMLIQIDSVLFTVSKVILITAISIDFIKEMKDCRILSKYKK